MRKDPALTYQGALAILGHHDRGWLDRVDRLLGGAILIAPASLVLGPSVSLLAALWAWVDHKNEAVSLVRSALDTVGQRVHRAHGYERHQLVAAAHTALVGAALMETLHETLGAQRFKAVGLSPAEQRRLVLDVAGSEAEHLLDQLYLSAVPAPAAARGFEENVAAVTAWYTEAAGRLRTFFAGLDPSVVPPRQASMFPKLVEAAASRYRSRYLQAATKVPEFFVWASLTEHAATRGTVAALGQDLAMAFHSQGAALRRLESVLTAMASTPAPRPADPCMVVRRANRAALDEPVVPSRWWQRPGEVVRFPVLAEGYVDPGYRVRTYDLQAALSDDAWWQQQPVHDDLDVRLVRYLTAPLSTSLPLLVLGHPGAGKSLLTKVLAARLPASWYTVVRVPLRQVGASDPVYQQIQTALDATTHRRVDWVELVERSRRTIRVVLLDGLDELLQASNSERAGYLHEVADFQRREAEQERPVAVVVTSRTVVADQVRVPLGVPVIRLEDFDTARVHRWLSTWNEVNEAAIADGALRSVSPDACLRHRALATQPLLLLMLALYLADPEARSLGADTSTTELYGALLSSFASREVSRTLPDMTADAQREAVRDQLWRLAVAAFAMFNRGRQDVTDVELGEDLRAIGDAAAPTRPAELGQRTFGQFFFVHAAEADGFRAEHTRHRYEFLHATFGEYLIAAHLLQELRRLAGTDRWPLRRDVPDEVLFALVSHQPLALRDNIVRLSADLFAALGPAAKPPLLRTLEQLIAASRQRQGSTAFAGYRPLPVDQVRQLAAYSANLILLRASFDPDGVVINRLWPDTDADDRWRSTVDLWRAGLDDDGWRAALKSLARHDRSIRATAPGDPHIDLPADLAYADLVGSDELTSSSSSTITQLIRSTQLLDPTASPLVFRFAQTEISRLAKQLKELIYGDSVTYEGEDRDWLLGLTNAVTTSIDATSLLSVDASVVDGGLWSSDLGQRYLESQRHAIHRGASVRRVFILDRPSLDTDPDLAEVCRLQQHLGIQVRILDSTTVPEIHRSGLFDFVIFDNAISYETTPASSVDGTTRPVIVKTRLELRTGRVQDRMARFRDLWESARDPR